MSKRITEASRFTVCFTCGGGTEQRFECTARDRDDALRQLKKSLKGKDWQGKDIPEPVILRIVPCWLGRVGLKD
jgi:hypothetical protein